MNEILLSLMTMVALLPLPSILVGAETIILRVCGVEVSQ